MNKWVKRGYLGFVVILTIGLFSRILGSFGVGVITIYLALILIGVIIFIRKLTGMQKCIGIGIVVLGYLYLHTFVAPSVTGQIVDKTTGKPIENVIIHAEYCLSFPTIAGGIPSRMGENLAVTDEHGNYRLKPKIGINFFLVDEPKIYVKVLHPLWEAKRKIIPLSDNWMLNKFEKPVRCDEEMLSLGGKYREGYETKMRSGICNSFGSELSEIEDYFKYNKIFKIPINYKEIKHKWTVIIGDRINRFDTERVFGVKEIDG